MEGTPTKGFITYILAIWAFTIVAMAIIGVRGSSVPESVRLARKANAATLIQAVRAAYQNPYERDQRFGLTMTYDGYIRFAIEGPAYVDVHPSKDAIIVNSNGRTNIYDDDGDGKYDSCFHCPVGWEPEQIQEDLESGIWVVLRAMGKEPL
jgi:hypothetical protein